MRNSRRFPLTGTIHVDVFLVGKYEEGKIGRSSDSKKRLAVVALEILEKGGVGRAYAKVIDHAGALLAASGEVIRGGGTTCTNGVGSK